MSVCDSLKENLKLTKNVKLWKFDYASYGILTIKIPIKEKNNEDNTDNTDLF